MSTPNDEYQDSNVNGTERANLADTTQDDYVSRTGQKQEPIPVQGDRNGVEAGGYEDADQADSDAQLKQDDTEAIDKSNIIKERTRGAKPAGAYTEPGDEEGLPGPDDGTSAVTGGPN